MEYKTIALSLLMICIAIMRRGVKILNPLFSNSFIYCKLVFS